MGKDRSIGIFGAKGSGKTMFIYSLYQNFSDAKYTEWNLFARDNPTITYFENLEKYLENREWPPLTQEGQFERISLQFIKDRVPGAEFLPNISYNIEVFDLSGEEYKRFIRFTKKERARIMKEKDRTSRNYLYRNLALSMKNWDGIVYLIDPNDNPKSVRKMFNALILLLKDVKNYKDNERIDEPFAFVFTKSDNCLAYKEGISPDKYAENRFTHLSHLVKDIIKSNNFNYFFCTMTGSITKDRKPPKILEPIGVVEPIEWIIKRI